jgi:TadE-like protein
MGRLAAKSRAGSADLREVAFSHHLPARRQLARARTGERGTSVVEAAIVTLAFFTLIAVLFEGSSLIRDSLGVSNAVRTASRTATVNGDEVYADYYTLRTLRKESSAIGIDDIQRIVVYRADGFGNPPTDSCKAGTSSIGTGAARVGACNVYTKADLFRPQTDFACRTAGALDTPWCPNVRKVAESGTAGPPDYIGVYLKYTHDLITGLFKGQRTLTDFVVVRMEPRKLS